MKMKSGRKLNTNTKRLRNKKKKQQNTGPGKNIHAVEKCPLDKEEIDDGDIDEEDLKYVQEINSSYSFLYKTKKRLQNSIATRHDDVGCDQSNFEEEYEKRPRLFKSECGESSVAGNSQIRHLLPIKQGGKIVHQSVMESLEEDELSEEDIEISGKVEDKKERTPASITFTSIEEAKQSIGAMCVAIVANPETNLKKLRVLERSLKVQQGVVVTQLILVSLLEVYKDIVPGYRIRVSSDREREQRAKKDTIEVREYEESLLKHYRVYLQALETLSNDADKKTPYAIRYTALQCLASLLIHLRHFNFINNIVVCILPFMMSTDDRMSDLIRASVRKMFVQDKAREASLEVVKAIGKMVKGKSYHVPGKVIDTFLSLPIKHVDTEGQREQESRRKKVMTHKEKMAKLSRSERKRSKHVEKVEKELEAAQAVESDKQKLRLSTDIITHVFTTYFRVLKKAASPRSPLLSSVLKGLSTFSHCINVDFYSDLLSTLHGLLTPETSARLPALQSLHCIHTVFTILSGYGQALLIDPHRFYMRLYEVMSGLKGSDEISMLLQCLDLMLLRRRKQVSLGRVLAFTKRLSILASEQTDVTLCLAILSFMRQIMMAFPKSDILLDMDNEGSGLYRPDINDPDHTNAHNTALYELFSMKEHRNVNIRHYSQHIASGCPVQGTGQLVPHLRNRSWFDILNIKESS